MTDPMNPRIAPPTPLPDELVDALPPNERATYEAVLAAWTRHATDPEFHARINAVRQHVNELCTDSPFEAVSAMGGAVLALHIDDVANDRWRPGPLPLGIAAPQDAPAGATVNIDGKRYRVGEDIHAGDMLAVDQRTGTLVRA